MHAAPMAQSWTIADLEAELGRFEQAARASGLTESSVQTYVGRARFFVRWLDGDFEFRGSVSGPGERAGR